MKPITLELNLTLKETGSFTIKSSHTIKADSMIQLLSQFALIVHKVEDDMRELELKEMGLNRNGYLIDDNIPF